MAIDSNERSPLLQHDRRAEDGGEYETQQGEEVWVEFSEGDKEDPRNWTKTRKMVNVGIIALMAGKVFPFRSVLFSFSGRTINIGKLCAIRKVCGMFDRWKYFLLWNNIHFLPS